MMASLRGWEEEEGEEWVVVPFFCADVRDRTRGTLGVRRRWWHEAQKENVGGFIRDGNRKMKETIGLQNV